MIIKEIDISGLPYNRAEVVTLLQDGSAKVELFNVDNLGQECGVREYSVSLGGSDMPLPFTLSDDELLELNPCQELQPSPTE